MDHSPVKRGCFRTIGRATNTAFGSILRNSRQRLDQVSRVSVAGESTSDERFAIPEQLHAGAQDSGGAEFGDVYSGLLGCFDPFNPQGDDGLSPLTVATNSSRALFTTPISQAWRYR